MITSGTHGNMDTMQITLRKSVVPSSGPLTSPAPVPGMIAAPPARRSLRLEGEDALLNGMTRSLQRRLMGLNVPVQATPVTPVKQAA